jgi:hypothetical protein
MKNIFLLNIHSFIDLITNSSSEIFIANSSHSIEFLKEILNEMVNTYGKLEGGGNISFDTVFGDIYIIENENDLIKYLDIIKWYVIQYDYDNPKKNKENEKQWLKEELQKFESYKGKIVIQSCDDNTIPLFIMEFLEWELMANRIHLG